MKIYIIIAVFLGIAACGAGRSTVAAYGMQNHKDTVVKDTFTYIQNELIAHKERYIGKELNVLMKDIRLEVKSYLRGVSSKNRYVSPDISLSFYSTNETRYRELVLGIKSTTIWIKWQTPLPADSISAIKIKKSGDKSAWGAEEHRYFGRQIVKDFGLVEYKKQ